LFAKSAPDIFVSDLYSPSPSRDSVPTETPDKAAENARKVAHRFSHLYSRTLDDKAHLQETMGAIVDAYAMLRLQWIALGQSPDHGIALLKKVKSHYPHTPFVFYSRKITPEDVICVLQAGAVDAIKKGALNHEEVLVRLATAQEIYRRKSSHTRPNVNVTLYSTL
jgi:DNA-binding NarL/FixJ family response regulator